MIMPVTTLSGMLAFAPPALLLLYLVWRREWEWIGFYVALSFAINAGINLDAVLTHLLEPSGPHREPLGSAITGTIMYLFGVIGAMRGASPLRTFFVALAAMETLFVAVVPIYRLAFGLDEGAYFAILGQDIPNSVGVLITLLFAYIPMMIGIPWMLARQSASDTSIIAPALARYGTLSGIGVVAFMTFATCFVAWGYIGRGPFSGEPQRPAFDMVHSTVGPNMVFGILMGIIIFLFWSFPKRFFDPVVNLLEASQSIDRGSLEDKAHPLWRGIARNLDESRSEAIESQRELNQMRSLLLSFFNTSPADMFVKTVDGRLVYCSPRLATVLGRTQEEMFGMHEGEYHSAEHLERIRKIDARLVRDKKPIVGEVYNPMLDRHELQTRFPIFNGAGDVTHIGGMFIDIDDRVKARQQQKKAEEWLESFVKFAPVPMILADPSHNRYLLANSVAAEFYDMTAEELVASDPADAAQYWPRWEEDMAPAIRKALVDREPQTVETVISRKAEGTVADYLVSLFPIIDDARELPLLASVGVDITAIRRAERALAEREAQLSALFEHVPADIAVFDRNHRVVMVNKITAQGLGENAATVRGRHPAEYAQHWEDFEGVFAAGIEVRNSGKPHRFTSRFNPPGKDRQVVYDTMFFPIKSAGGEVEQVGLFLFDVTKQVEAEQALAEQTSQIHQSEKLAALGQLLAGVSHELNNPLAAVIGQTALLGEDLEGTEHADRISKIRRAADRCARIVQSFLAMARQKAPEYRSIHVNDQVRAAVELTEYQMRAADVTLELRLADDLPAIKADPDQLHQVIVNLLTNARQALEESAGERTITITTARHADQIKLTIADTGKGIDAATRDKIFDPYFTTKAEGTGTGIGLSYSLGIIEAHGGKITIEDAEIGTVFAVTLPAKGEADGLAATETRKPAIAKGKVLIIDDEEDVGETLADMLKRMGMDVRVEIGGVAGRAALAEGRMYDLILSDIRMPEIDGPALYAWTAEHRPEQLGAFAFVTGDTLSGHAAAFLETVNCPILEKPFTPAGLRDLVTAVLKT